MNKIEFYAGESLEQAYQDLQKNTSNKTKPIRK